MICRAQTASDYITQGRSYLAVSNIVSASVSFSNAVALSPNDPTANVFYGLSRLFALPSQPAVSNFLTTLGVPTTGRNIYQWKARLPHDAQRFPIAPAGVSLSDCTALARGSVLSEIIGAEANLAVVTDTNFTLALTVQDTSITAVTMDYGDIQLIRSFLDGMEYFVYNTYDWNLDVQLTVLRSLYSSNTFDIGTLLSEYPSLLTFSTTNDLLSAKAAFVKSANTYFTASSIIRNRPADVTRLFNYAPDDAQDETPFRETLFDVTSSLTNGPVLLEVNSNYSILLSSTFSGAQAPRAFLPRIYGRGFVAGSLPDATFGGIVGGLSDHSAEGGLSEHFNAIPEIIPGQGPGVQFHIHGIAGRGYIVQSSSNLLNWSNVFALVAYDGNYPFTNRLGNNQSNSFYRVVDSTSHMPPPINDNFANRIPVSGYGLLGTSYDINATTENSEPGNGFASIWWSWTAPASGQVVVLARGTPGYPGMDIYTGSELGALNQVPVINSSYYHNGTLFQASAGQNYKMQALSFGGQGAVQLVIGALPNLVVTSPITGTILSNHSITISASANDSISQITSISYSIYSNVFVVQKGTVNGSSMNLIITNLASGFYSVSETASNLLGLNISMGQGVTLQ
jgi:hypothetical protein